MSRPEHSGPAERCYSAGEARRYENNARMEATQRALADRALQLLDLPVGAPALLLDAGCGTGYSGRPLERAGHTWIGVDVSVNMLRSARTVCSARHSSPAAVVASDLGSGLPFRSQGVFDGCISISAVQWLCHATRPDHDPPRRVAKFFSALRAVLAAGARAVLQVYPEQPQHMSMLRDAALHAGFSGGLVVDYPWSERSKKLFLVLIAPVRNTPQKSPRDPPSGSRGGSARDSIRAKHNSGEESANAAGNNGGKRRIAAAVAWEAALAPKKAGKIKKKKQQRREPGMDG